MDAEIRNIIKKSGNPETVRQQFDSFRSALSISKNPVASIPSDIAHVIAYQLVYRDIIDTLKHASRKLSVLKKNLEKYSDDAMNISDEILEMDEFISTAESRSERRELEQARDELSRRLVSINRNIAKELKFMEPVSNQVKELKENRDYIKSRMDRYGIK